MTTDPLSSATRTAKRNLLVASVLAITFKAFNVHIDKIPVAGLSIDFDDRLFSFLLLLTNVYFLLIFALYFFIDIRNVKKTEHQEKSDKTYENHIAWANQAFDIKVQQKLTELLPEKHQFAFRELTSTGAAVGRAYSEGVRPEFEIRVHVGSSTKPVPREGESAEHYAKMDAAFAKEWSAFKRKRALIWVKESLRWNAVAGAYAVRNYVTDGTLPILLGVVAIATLFGIVNMSWLQRIAP